MENHKFANFSSLPEWLKKLWEIDSVLAREAEAALSIREISSDEAIKAARETHDELQSSNGYDIKSFNAGFFKGIAYVIKSRNK
jgi:hypothetical protein